MPLVAALARYRTFGQATLWLPLWSTLQRLLTELGFVDGQAL